MSDHLTHSRVWDTLTARALDEGRAIAYGTIGHRALGRTADPRVNPGAVTATESSTTYRRGLQIRDDLAKSISRAVTSLALTRDSERTQTPKGLGQ
jgi:hypothetical protein